MGWLRLSLIYRLSAIIICSGSLSTKKEWQYIITLCFFLYFSATIYNVHMSWRDRWLEEFDSSAIFSRVFGVRRGKDSPRIARHPEGRRKSNVNHSQTVLKIVSRFSYKHRALSVAYNKKLEALTILGFFLGRKNLALKLCVGFLEDTAVIIQMKNKIKDAIKVFAKYFFSPIS